MAVATGAQVATVVPSRMRSQLSGTPGMLRLSLAVSVVAVVVFAVVAGESASSRRQSLIGARQAAAQAVRIQQVDIALVSADALATNAFLVGGLEPAEQRTKYEAGITAAATGLADAANHADASDVAGLMKANVALTTYTGLIESARANNRQLFPVGVAYLKQGSALLKSNVLPELEKVSTASEQRVADAYGAADNAGYAFWIAAALVLAVMLVVQFRLSAATRRTFNIPILAGTGLILLAIIYGGSAMALASSNADSARTGPYAATTALTAARIDAFTAKSAESLTLISRGNGAPFEEQWKSSYEAATKSIASLRQSSLTTALSAYATVHQAIRTLDDGGDWDNAVKQATSFDTGSSNQVFDVFADASEKSLDASARSLDSSLGDASSDLTPTRVAIFALGLVSLVAIGTGFTRRLRDYR